MDTHRHQWPPAHHIITHGLPGWEVLVPRREFRVASMDFDGYAIAV